MLLLPLFIWLFVHFGRTNGRQCRLTESRYYRVGRQWCSILSIFRFFFIKTEILHKLDSEIGLNYVEKPLHRVRIWISRHSHLPHRHKSELDGSSDFAQNLTNTIKKNWFGVSAVVAMCLNEYLFTFFCSLPALVASKIEWNVFAAFFCYFLVARQESTTVAQYWQKSYVRLGNRLSHRIVFALCMTIAIITTTTKQRRNKNNNKRK